MSFISKIQPILIMAAAVFGMLIGQNTVISANSSHFTEIFLMLMLFLVFLVVDIKAIKKSFTNIKFSTAALIINFIWTPVFVFILSKLFLADSQDLQIGFIMIMVTPCTDWYLIFTGMSKGNVPLGSSILPMNLILQIVLLPFYLWIFMGSSVSLSVSSLVFSIVIVLIIPFTVAGIVKSMAKALKKGEMLDTFVNTYGDNMQLVFLCLVIIAMFSSQGKVLADNIVVFIRLFIPFSMFFAVMFVLSFNTGKLLKMPFEDCISLIFTTTARNSPIALAIAAVTFPDKPLILLPLVVGSLIELPVLTSFSMLINKYLRS